MIIGGRRVCGKTTHLIKESNRTWTYIVCSTSEKAHHIFRMTEEMVLDIPYPITVRELPIKSPYIKDILIYDVEEVLYMLPGKNAKIITSSDY